MTSKRVALTILSVLSLLCALRVLSPIFKQSATFDEGVKIGAGYAQFKQHYFLYDHRSPPFSKFLISWPLLLLNPSIPVPEPALAAQDPAFFKDHFPFGYRFLFNNRLPADTMLVYTRLGVWGVYASGGIFLFLFLYRKYGLSAAAIGNVLYFLCPDIAATAAVATSDILAIVFAIPVVIAAISLYENPSRKNAVIAGIALGLGVCTKYSLLIFIPLFAYILFKFYLRKAKASELAVYGTILIGCLLFIIEANYLFMDPSAIYGMIHETLDVVTGARMSYFLGQYTTGGFLYYFPLAILLKTPLPVLAAAAYAVYLYVTKKGCREPAAEITGLAIVLLAGVSIFSTLDLGIRYILPIYPLVFLFIAIVLHRSVVDHKKLAAIFLCLVISNVMVHPHYQSYFNLLIGKNENAYKYFADSAVDWGQDLKELGEYLKSEGSPELTLSYFGTASPNYYGIQYQNLESNGLDAVYDNTRYRQINSDTPRRELLAVSATCRIGVDYPNHHWFDFLNELKPIRVIGNSIFVYDITGNVSTYKHIAQIYYESRHQVHLLRCGRVIAGLDPADPFGKSAVEASQAKYRTYYDLGVRYERSHDLTNARKAYIAALAFKPGDAQAIAGLQDVQASKEVK